MARVLGLFALGALAATLSAAPALKDRADENLYAPLHVGDKRTFELRRPGGTSEHIDMVTKVEKKNGVIRVTIGRVVDGKTTPWTQFDVSKNGVYRNVLSGDKLPEPVPVIKLPLKPGETWNDEQATNTVGKEEDVEVPAGKYRAIRIDTVGDNYKQSCWYAPNVGLVKVLTLSGNTEHSQVLKSFRPGEK